MTYGEFQSELRKAGLGVGDFADLVGMRRNSVSNYARSAEVPQHLALIAALFAEVFALGKDPRDVVARVGTVPKRPRGGSKAGRFGGDPQAELEWNHS